MRRPVFQLWKGGIDLMEAMDPYFMGASLTDAVGSKNDELRVVLNDEMRRLPLPRQDDLLFPRAGYRETGVAELGAFKVQNWSSGWDSGGPETMIMTARAATYTGEIKAFGAKHWDDTTLGAILSDTAKAAGLKLAIDPSLAEIRISYALRWEASPIDFAMRLAAEHGGVGKPGGERFSVVKRGEGTDTTGAALPIIKVTRKGSGGWNMEGEPRPAQGKVCASWHDPKTGRRQVVSEATGRQGPIHALIHPRASEAEAESAAKAAVAELNMETGQGFFITEFEPHYSAGAIVEASGFGEGIDGRWPSERIQTDWRKGGAVLSTIDVTAQPKGDDDDVGNDE